MALLDLLYRSRERRFSLEDGNVPLTAASITRLMAGDEVAAGITVTPEKAAGLTAVWRAVSLLSSTAASLPLESRRRNDATVTTAELLEGRSQVWTAYELKELVMVHLLLHGNAYLLRSGRNLVPLDPRNVDPKFVMRGDEPTGRVYVVRRREDGTEYALTDEELIHIPGLGFDGLAGQSPISLCRQSLGTALATERHSGKFFSNGTEYALTDEELIHIPGLGFDGLAGQSPISLCRQSLGTALATERHSGKFFSNGTQISGILKTDKRLKEEEANVLKRRWQQKVAGQQHAWDIAVLDNGAEFSPISISPADAQLIEARSFGVEEIARLFGVPPHLLADSSKTSSWGAGLAEQNAAFVSFSLKPYLARIEERLAPLVPGTQRPHFNTTSLTRGTTKERYGAHRLALDSASWMTINEVRAAEGMPPIDGGDVLPINGSRPVEVEEIQKQ